MQLVQRKNLTCFVYFDTGNLSNFAVIKSLHKFGGCSVGDNTFFF